MKQFVLFGYPCIGKTSLVKKIDNTIDLESSCFSQNCPEHWEAQYLSVAFNLMDQGYNICLSTHGDVLAAGIPAAGYVRNFKKKDIVFLFAFPDMCLKDYWIKKAGERFERSCSEKDKRALDRIEKYFDYDIKAIEGWCREYEGDVVFLPITSEDYDLAEMIKEVCKEGEGFDDNKQ